MKKLNTPTSFRLRSDVLDKLDVLAEFEGRSRANMLKALVEQAYGTAIYRLAPEDAARFKEAERKVYQDAEGG